MKTFAILGAAILLSPIAATAATYNYVDTMGMIDAVEAPSAYAALSIASDIHPNSGVALNMGVLESGDDVAGVGGSGDASAGTDGQYHYVNVTGEVRTVAASSASQALLASDIHPNSGVAADLGVLDAGDDVPGI